MKAIAVLILLACLSGAGLAQVEPDDYVPLKTEFDRFKGETTVQTEAMKVFGTKYDHISLMFGYLHTGSAPPAKLPLLMFVNVVIKSDEAPALSEVDVIAGSKRFTINGFMKPVMEHLLAAVYLHQFAAIVTFDKALEIARADKPEMRFGKIEVVLSQKQVNALRRILKRIDPSLPLKED